MGKQELAVMIPVLAVFFGGLLGLSRTAIGKALARRIGGDVQSPALEHEVRELRADVDSLRGELAEAQERIDFAERLIAGVRKES